MTAQDRLFPIFLKLSGRIVLLVGGGTVAEGKLQALLESGARVHVVSPKVTPAIEQMSVKISRRKFIASDLDDAWLVVAAATPEANQIVASEAERRHIFVNAVDDVNSATAYLGGVTRRAGVTFAISTDGQAPALAGLLREGLEAILPDSDLEAWVAEAARLRQRWRSGLVSMSDRRPELLRALIKRYNDKRT